MKIFDVIFDYLCPIYFLEVVYNFNCSHGGIIRGTTLGSIGFVSPHNILFDISLYFMEEYGFHDNWLETIVSEPSWKTPLPPADRSVRSRN